MDKKPILVTSALPYANGPIHFGHIAGAYLPADVFVRYHRLLKDDVVYVCGTDEYGVAITIGAEKEGRSPKEHVDLYHGVIREIFKKFNIGFDHFSRTTNPLHGPLTQKMFKELNDNGHIELKTVEQHYCAHCQRFLADRFIEGTCYLCGGKNARGDECPHCGAWLDPLKLKEPLCKICGKTPEIRKTDHWFLKLGTFKEKLKAWIDAHPYWKSNVVNAAKSQIETLESRPITRDLSWGVPVPLPEAKGKVLYVWFDAPIGYVDATMEWAEKMGKPEEWKKYWQNPDCRIVNFIGKDNIPFHLLVWPAMLMGQTTRYTLAENVPANEFYNLEGRQFSKSEGWYVDLESCFQKYKADQIRYAIGANAPETKDSDFNWRDFQKFCNSDLAGVYGNLLNRVMTFTHKNFEGKIPSAGTLPANMQALLEDVKARKAKIAGLYDTYQLKKASYEVIDMARAGNKFFDESTPWEKIKTDKNYCGQTLFTLFRLLEQVAIVSYPIMPESAEAVFTQLGIEQKLLETGWNSPSLIPEDGSHSLGKAFILFKKVEDDEIKEEITKLEAGLKKVMEKEEKKMNYEPLLPEVEYDDFAKTDLRIGHILSAEPVKGSKKLVKLQVDLGFAKRQILAGIAEYYKPEELPGKKVVVVANLKPRKMMGEMSEGMILAASLDGKLNLVEGGAAEPGSKVK